ncbi:MAG TPA: hypothetical protein DCP28_20240 [Cytophagales bacterium]|nr:hypothetical protein [Cytophagales bacterium]
MKRRKFLKNMSLTMGAPFALGGVPVKLLAQRNGLHQLASQSTNDRILVILQMHGGNDGLNTLVPIHDYDLYRYRRPNIAIPFKNGNRTLIPLDSTLPSEAQVGLHPDMQDMKDLYDQGRVGIVQGVSYHQNNGSHFRGRDIWNMGGGSRDYYSSGWVGRYLNYEFSPLEYPDQFPNEDMEDPLAVEIGTTVSLLFHQTDNIPTSISLGSSPEGFANLIDSLEGFDETQTDPKGIPPEFMQPTRYGKEIEWILGLEQKSEEYADRLFQVYQQSTAPTVTYPETYPFTNARNPLSGQFQLISRLLEGGCKTKVFLVKVGGFDTHADQVVEGAPTLGAHAQRLYHIASAVKAFQADLRARGLEDRVLTVTMSEFGRRIASNGSFGTDHGTGGPMMIFGKHVKPGVQCVVPDLNLSNVGMQYDYRQVYSTLLRDWLEVPQQEIIDHIFFEDFFDGEKEDGSGNYEPLELYEFDDGSEVTSVDFIAERYGLDDPYPNPASGAITLRFHVNGVTRVTLSLMDASGRVIKSLHEGQYAAGKYEQRVSLAGVVPGNYLVNFATVQNTETKPIRIR